jgi:MFS family permease
MATLPRERSSQADAGSFTARQALRNRTFWLTTIGHGFSSMINQTLLVHLVPMLTDRGLSLQMAAYVSATIMGVGAVFQLVGGYAGDKMPKNVAYAIFAAIQAAGFMLAVFVRSVPMAFLAATVYGIGHSGRTPLSVALRAEYFGPKAFGTITGVSLAPMHIMQVVAPLFAAVLFDVLGSYTVPFIVLGLFGFSGAVLFLLAKRPAPPAHLPSAREAGEPA